MQQKTSRRHTLFLFLFLLTFPVSAKAVLAEIVQSLSLIAVLIPYKTCVVAMAVLYCAREFPHLNTPVFEDKKWYSQYGNHSDFYVLHLHGWGMNAHAESFTYQEVDEVYIVSPRFSETINKKLFTTSFGQDCDVLATLHTLHETHHTFEKIHVIAHCRGAAVFINTVAVLCNPEHTLLSQVGISEQERLLILEKFIKGGIILISPFLSVSHFIKDWTFGLLAFFVNFCILPWLTRYQYDPYGMHVLKSISNWQVKLPIHIIFPEQDSSIGTSLRTEFIDLLSKKNDTNYTRVTILPGETKHWPPFLKTMSYKEFFQRFDLEIKPDL